MSRSCGNKIMGTGWVKQNEDCLGVYVQVFNFISLLPLNLLHLEQPILHFRHIWLWPLAFFHRVLLLLWLIMQKCIMHLKHVKMNRGNCQLIQLASSVQNCAGTNTPAILGPRFKIIRSSSHWMKRLLCWILTFHSPLFKLNDIQCIYLYKHSLSLDTFLPPFNPKNTHTALSPTLKRASSSVSLF